jgi:peptidoglycan/LPS O-acetylase OafA/YrhL
VTHALVAGGSRDPGTAAGRRDPGSAAGQRGHAIASGAAGMLADLLLVTRPFGGFPWLTPAYGVVVAIQFVTFMPVAVSVGRRLPALRSVRLATAAALVAMAAVALLHLIPVAGARPVPGQTAGLLVVFGWIFTISGTGHRTGRLPRTATRLGLLIGASFLLAVVVLGPGLLLAPGSWTRVAFVGTGHVIEALGRLALPLWPLALARRQT